MSPTHFHDRHAKPNENALSHPQFKINKNSHMIKKSSSSSPPASSSLCVAGPAKVAPQQRHPVIIYTHSPKVIHTHPRDFMALVQKLTGLSRSEEDQKPQMKQDNGKRSNKAAEEDQRRNSFRINAGNVDDNDSISSVITADENCGSIGTDHGQVNSCFLAPNIYEPSNPYMANIPVFTPNSADFLCANPAFYNYTDSFFFTTPNIRTNPSTLEGINEFHLVLTTKRIQDSTILPLNRTEANDTLVWKETTNGKYSVRSGYHCLTSVTTDECPDSSRGWWKFMWGLSIPPKFKTFMWRLGSDSLPTRVNLARRGVSVDPVCPCCNAEVETTRHLLLYCPFAKGVWGKFAFWNRVPGLQGDNWVAWLAGIHTSLDESDIEKLISILWSLWTSRNSKIFRQRDESIEEVVIRGGRLLSDFKVIWCQQQRPAAPTTQTSTQKWKPPTSGVVKINTDAAVGTTSIGLGFIARNERGETEFSGAIYLPHRSESQTAEALALRDATTQVRQWEYNNIIIESDCLQNVHALTNGDFPLSYAGLVLEEVARLASTFHSCSFQHVRRSMNTPAHELGQLALISGLGNVWIGGCPEAIASFVLADLN